MTRTYPENKIHKAMKKAPLAKTSEAIISTTDEVKTRNRGVTDYA